MLLQKQELFLEVNQKAIYNIFMDILVKHK